MVARERLDRSGGGSYFARPKDGIEFIHTGSKVLDLALGGGWAERRIGNIVGDKCLSGDTVVSVRRSESGRGGRKLTMQELFNRFRGNHFNKNHELDTYLAADIGGYAGMAKMVNIVASGEKTLYEITSDRGTTIKASEDHKFSTVDGWKCLSDGLDLGSVVKHWRGTRGVVEHLHYNKKRSTTYSVPFHPFAAACVVAGRDYKRINTARLIIEAAINGMTLAELIRVLRKDPNTAASLQYTDPELEVHHLDGDPTNNSLENLQLVTPQEHWEIHADEMPVNTKKIELAEIVSVNRVGKELTFDITMEAPHHNFIANNFVVHNSSGKTLLMIEAAVNFSIKYPNAKVRYRETEAVFDKPYAQALGMPIDRIDFGNDVLDTVEDMFDDLTKIVEKSKQPELVIIDSLDALSDRAEMKRGIDEGTYGATKAKQLSQMFRRMVRAMESAHVTLLIVNQIRDKIGVLIGRKTTRSGGRALDFYASQVVYLSQIQILKKTVQKVTRPVGIEIRAKVEKNKISLPFREAQFPIIFGYGIDDERACREFLTEVGQPATKEVSLAQLHQRTEKVWFEIESRFIPDKTKYGSNVVASKRG